MSDFFEKPAQGDTPTKGGSTVPWTIRAEYKSGKTPPAFADAATPEQVKAGFSYYDKEAGAKVTLENFTASIVAITFGVSGTVPDGNFYINYLSNLVFDTRDQPMEVFHFVGPHGDKKKAVVASGHYNDFKANLPNGVGYCKVLICWIHEIEQLASFQVSASMEQALKEGIATATGEKLGKISLFGIAESVERFWTFRFKAGQFTKRTKDGAKWAGQGDMFFYPNLTCGVMTAANVPGLPDHKQAVSDYIEASQKYLWEESKAVKASPEVEAQAQQAREAAFSQPTPPRTNGGFADPVAAPFPTNDTTNFEQGAEPNDDFPANW